MNLPLSSEGTVLFIFSFMLFSVRITVGCLYIFFTLFSVRITVDYIFSLAHMIYKSKEEAEKVFREADDIEIHGAKMTVLYVDNTPKRNWRKEKLQKIKVFFFFFIR